MSSSDKLIDIKNLLEERLINQNYLLSFLFNSDAKELEILNKVLDGIELFKLKHRPWTGHCSNILVYKSEILDKICVEVMYVINQRKHKNIIKVNFKDEMKVTTSLKMLEE